jgi:hypothetical protein
MNFFLLGLGAEQAHGFVMAVKYPGRRMDLAEDCLQRLTCFRILHFGEEEKVGSAKMQEGFSEDAPWQEVIVSKADL